MVWSWMRSRRVLSLEVATTDDCNAGWRKDKKQMLGFLSLQSRKKNPLWESKYWSSIFNKITFLTSSSSSASLSWRMSLLALWSPASLQPHKDQILIRDGTLKSRQGKKTYRKLRINSNNASHVQKYTPPPKQEPYFLTLVNNLNINEGFQVKCVTQAPKLETTQSLYYISSRDLTLAGLLRCPFAWQEGRRFPCLRDCVWERTKRKT